MFPDDTGTRANKEEETTRDPSLPSLRAKPENCLAPEWTGLTPSGVEAGARAGPQAAGFPGERFPLGEPPSRDGDGNKVTSSQLSFSWIQSEVAVVCG